MRPQFNPRPVNKNNGIRPLLPQPIMGNPGNFGTNPMQMMPQFQLGMLNNPQPAMQSFSNQNALLPPAQLFPFQQASMQNPNNSNNNLQQMLQFNAMNPAQFLSNGQNMQNLVQTMNQLMQMQMQVQMQMANCGPQNPGFLPNIRPGMMSGNGSKQGNPDVAKAQSNVGAINGNNMVQQFVPNGHLNVPNVNQILPMQMPLGGLQNTTHLANMQMGLLNCNGVMQPLQGNIGGVNEVNKLDNNWSKSHNNNSAFNRKSDVSQRGFNKKQSHHKQSTNFKSDCDNRVKVQENPIQEGKKRSLVLNYSAKEIQEWREARRKNHPSKANDMEGVKEKAVEADDGDAASKARRQQLKDILAKQAELGIEVAEIPAYYLSDSERQVDSRGANRRRFSRGGRFQNKFDKRGKFRQNNRCPKKQKPRNHDPSNSENHHVNKRQRYSHGSTSNTHMDGDSKNEPSFLKKLLSSDSKRDNKHLLHAFKFMGMNSFFKDWPEKPLKFPQVIVRESGNGNDNTSIDIAETTEGFINSNIIDEDSVSCGGDDVLEYSGQLSEEDGEILE